MAVYTNPGYSHFFSYQTKVSFELPLEWEEESEGQATATYAYELDEDEPEFERPPKIVVRAIAVPVSESDAYTKLGQTILDRPRKDLKVESRREDSIDDTPATVDVYSFLEEQTDTRVVHYQALTQIENIVFSIAGIVDESHKDEVLPVFEDAVKSVRFILI